MERPVVRRVLLVADRSPSETARAVAAGFASRLGGGVELLELGRSGSDPNRSGAGRVSAVDRVRARLAAEPMDVVVCADHGTHRNTRSAVVDLIDGLLADGVQIVVVNEDVFVGPSDLPVVAYVGESAEVDAIVPPAARWANTLGVPLVLVAVTPPALAPPQVPPSLAESRTDLAGVALRELAERTAVSWPQLHVSARLIEYRWEKQHAIALFLDRHPAQLVVMPATEPQRHTPRPAVDGMHSSPLVRELAVAVLLVPDGIGVTDRPLGTAPFADASDHA